MGRQGGVGRVMVGEADDARVVFRAAPVVAEVELFEAEDLGARFAGEPVHGGAPYATATHDDVLERRLACPVHTRLPARITRFSLLSRSSFAALLVRHTVQFVAGLGFARRRTPLAFVGRRLAERLRHLPDVGRDRAAAGAYVVVAEVAGPQRELAHRGAGEGYLLQLVRELGERDEVGPLARPVERYGLGCHVDRIGDSSAHLLHKRKHVLGRTKAVGADDVDAGVGETPYLLAWRIALEGVGVVIEAHGYHRGEPRGLDGFGGDHGLPGPVEGLSDDEVHALPTHDVELAIEELAGTAVGLGVIGLVDPGAAQVASDEDVSICLTCDPTCDPGGLTVHVVYHTLEPNGRQLVLAGVESERLEHVDPGVDELPMQSRQGLGMVYARLGHERTGLHVAPALQLEQIAAVTQDDAL